MTRDDLMKNSVGIVEVVIAGLTVVGSVVGSWVVVKEDMARMDQRLNSIETIQVHYLESVREQTKVFSDVGIVLERLKTEMEYIREDVREMKKEKGRS